MQKKSTKTHTRSKSLLLSYNLGSEWQVAGEELHVSDGLVLLFNFLEN